MKERQAVYGMIHQAARDMAVAHLGEAEWEALATSHGLSGHHFIGVDYYSDADTRALVKLIARRLALPASSRSSFAFLRLRPCEPTTHR